MALSSILRAFLPLICHDAALSNRLHSQTHSKATVSAVRATSDPSLFQAQQSKQMRPVFLP